MAKKILIVTLSDDLHADLVTKILLSKDCQPFRINLDVFPRDYQISQSWIQGRLRSEVVHVPSGEVLDLKQVGATWVRKTARFAFLSQDLTPQERAYAELETEHALSGLLYTLDCYWMSHPLAVRQALWKGEQLQRAARMGFRIPASLITNSPDKVKEFKKSIKSNLIFKSMSSPYLGAEKVAEEDRISGGITTTIVTDDMMECIESVSELTCHFQEYIPKQYELRVTMIGNEIFAAKMHTQDDVRTTIDSRDMSAPILYESTVLPPQLAQRCLSFIHSYGLNYSAMDIIVTPDNEYVFLENNPGGQFLYVEQLIPEFNMLETLADRLIAEAACHN